MSEAVTLVGGAPLAPGAMAAMLNWSVARAPRIVAADGGAAAVLATGRMPEAVIGDMDSLPPETRAAIPDDRLVPVAEQDSTDFEKCLQRIDAPVVIGAGFTGARVDHTLGALNVLARTNRPCLLLGERDAILHLTRPVALDLARGTRVSLFPFASCTGRSRGLRWPIDGIDLSPGGRIGTSNVADGPVEIAMNGPGCLLLLPADCKDAALAALTAP